MSFKNCKNTKMGNPPVFAWFVFMQIYDFLFLFLILSEHPGFLVPENIPVSEKVNSWATDRRISKGPLVSKSQVPSFSFLITYF